MKSAPHTCPFKICSKIRFDLIVMAISDDILMRAGKEKEERGKGKMEDWNIGRLRGEKGSNELSVGDQFSMLFILMFCCNTVGDLLIFHFNKVLKY
jgi:hypothetical protein